LEELPLVGVFSSDSPHRPNPLAVTIVELVKREGSQLFVNGLDLFNNTPVLDIKHYTPNRVIQNISLPQWYKELEDKVAQAEKVTG
jgi:tRNA (Thr-GGU) A37 N-methylase